MGGRLFAPSQILGFTPAQLRGGSGRAPLSNCRIPFVIAALVVASAPTFVAAQAQPLNLSSETAGRLSISDQVRGLAAKLEAEVALKRISSSNADRVHRELNEVQAQIAADRDRHGGRNTVAERFDLQDQVDKIADEIQKDTVGGAPIR